MNASNHSIDHLHSNSVVHNKKDTEDVNQSHTDNVYEDPPDSKPKKKKVSFGNPNKVTTKPKKKPLGLDLKTEKSKFKKSPQDTIETQIQKEYKHTNEETVNVIYTKKAIESIELKCHY